MMTTALLQVSRSALRNAGERLARFESDQDAVTPKAAAMKH